MGSDFFLHIGYEFSSYGNESCVTGTGQSIPCLLYTSLPTDMPAGVVDLDNTATTRSIIRNLDAFQQTKIIAHYPSFADRCV